MQRENAINFLLYSYFDLTLKSKKDEIIQEAIKRAYQDASSHVLSVPDERKKYFAKKNASQKLKEEITKLMNGKKVDPDEYKEWHIKICTELKSFYNGITTDDKTFTYGVAQKWVNMTMKYLCVLYSIFTQYNQDSDFYNDYKKIIPELEKYLHVPIDSFILESASKRNKKSDTYGFEIEIANKETITANEKEQLLGGVGFYSEKSLPWSKYDATEGNWEKGKDPYHNFQESLKAKIHERYAEWSLLDWEGPAWIEIAQDRKRKEQEREREKFENENK